MKTTTEHLFSNGTEHMLWIERNCERCLKQSTYNAITDEYTDFRCSIDRDIVLQASGFSEVSIRSYQATRNADCPYIQTIRKPPKRRKIKGQIELFK